MLQDRIRNFSIIAHIDHGKSTLADRILELTHAVSQRDMRDQRLDSMDLERERGITIKAQAVRVVWKGYQLNLIDTPGHVDFTYEVSRSLQACEGALLVVDAAQGIEAQTLANAYLAIENDLDIVPVVNKIDLPAADPDGVAAEVAELIGDAPENVLRISAKTGQGIEAVLQAVVDHISPPDGDPQAPPRALIFDSSYDQYRGVLAFVRMVDGGFHKGDKVCAMAQGTRFDVEELGFFSPGMRPAKHLSAGEVGYIVTGLKNVSQLRVGDTLTLSREGAAEPLEREYDLDLLVTAPNVAYRVQDVKEDWHEVHNPAQMPASGDVLSTEEPYVRASLIAPKEFVGPLMELTQDRRGEFGHMEYLSEERVQLVYDLPLAEVVLDYYDQLNARSRGYASFDYDVLGFREGKLVKVDVLLAGEQVDSLSLITHRDNAYKQGKALVEALRERIPRQMFEVAIQAAIGSRVIARETVKAKRKDVLAKCYGGDITRKRKLLEKQKKGKRRMKQVGNIEVPQEAFLAVLEINREGAA